MVIEWLTHIARGAVAAALALAVVVPLVAALAGVVLLFVVALRVLSALPLC